MVLNRKLLKSCASWVVLLSVAGSLAACSWSPWSGSAGSSEEKVTAAETKAAEAPPPKKTSDQIEDEEFEVLATPIAPAPEVQESQALAEPAPVADTKPVESKAEKVEPLPTDPNTFLITVKDKTPDHPNYGKGNKKGFYVNNVPGDDIVLRRGETYTFRVQTSVKHDFYISRSPIGWGSGVYIHGVSGHFTYDGDVTLNVDENTPDTLYYQCRNHKNMGGRIIVVNKDADIAAVKKTLAEERKAAQKIVVAAKQPEVDEKKAKQKLAYVEMMLKFKGASLSPGAKTMIEGKIGKAKEAFAAKNYAATYGFADEASQLFKAPAVAKVDEDELKELRKEYNEKIEAIHSIEKSHQRAYRDAEKAGEKPVDYDRAAVAKMFAAADKMADKNDFDGAKKELIKIEHTITKAINAMLGSKTVVFELKFDTPADEYKYEVSRYESYLELIPTAIEVRKPSEGAIKLANNYVDKSKFYAGKAEESFKAKRYDEAIVIIKDATREVRRGLMLLGVTM